MIQQMINHVRAICTFRKLSFEYDGTHINEHLGKKVTMLLRINYAQCVPFENYLMIMMEPIIMEPLFHETNIGEIFRRYYSVDDKAFVINLYLFKKHLMSLIKPMIID